MVTAAAKSMPGDVLVRPRSWLLSQASNADPEAMVVVEISERVVAVVGAETVGVPRGVQHRLVAEEVATVIDEMSSSTTAVVLIDVPSTVADAPGLAAAIASEVRNSGRRTVEIDAKRLSRLAGLARTDSPNQRESSQPQSAPSAVGVRSPRLMLRGACGGRCRLRGGGAGCGRSRPARCSAADDGTHDISGGGSGGTDGAGNWTAQRVVAGPGSARVQSRRRQIPKRLCTSHNHRCLPAKPWVWPLTGCNARSARSPTECSSTSTRPGSAPGDQRSPTAKSAPAIKCAGRCWSMGPFGSASDARTDPAVRTQSATSASRPFDPPTRSDEVSRNQWNLTGPGVVVLGIST